MGTAAAVVSATALVISCQRGVLDKASATIAIDGGRGVMGDGGANEPRLLSCDALTPVAADWTAVAPPARLDGLEIRDAWAAASDDLFFAGTRPLPGDDSQWLAQVVRWQRGCWSLELSWQFPSSPGVSVSISGSGFDDIWAAMGNALFHGGGAGWSRSDEEIQTLLTAQHSNILVAPSYVRVAAGTVWVAGANFIWQRDAGQWRMFELPNSEVFSGDGAGSVESTGSFRFTALWAGGRDDAVVGGTIDVIGRIPDVAFVYVYDGSGWTLQGVSEGGVASVRGDGMGGVWITLFNGNWNPNPLVRYDRRGGADAVSDVAIDGWPTHLDAHALWGRASDDVFVANGGNLAHWDGLGWKMTAAPPTTSADDDPIIAGAAGSTWIVRRGPRFFRRDH